METVEVEVLRERERSRSEGILLAAETLHSLDRQAEHFPALATEVYPIRDAYLRALLSAGRGDLYWFEVEQDCGGRWSCSFCSTEWFGRDQCMCFGCREVGHYEPNVEVRRWYRVEVEGRAFRIPGSCLDGVLEPSVLERATQSEPYLFQLKSEPPTTTRQRFSVDGRRMTYSERVEYVKAATKSLLAMGAE